VPPVTATVEENLEDSSGNLHLETDGHQYALPILPEEWGDDEP
jgi:hypothetical protein